jgi:hypothetical protein
VRRGWVRQAVTDDAGAFDVGNLSLFALMWLVLGVVPYMCLMVGVAAFVPTVKFDPKPLGIAVAAVCGGFATAIGALGAYRRLADNGTGKPPGVVTTTTATQTATTVAPQGN